MVQSDSNWHEECASIFEYASHWKAGMGTIALVAMALIEQPPFIDMLLLLGLILVGWSICLMIPFNILKSASTRENAGRLIWLGMFRGTLVFYGGLCVITSLAYGIIRFGLSFLS